MIPQTNKESESNFSMGKISSKTYAFDLEKGTIGGYCDGILAVEQAVYKILNTERYRYLIYSWDYGAEIATFFGKGANSVYEGIKKSIEEALLQDDRITAVTDFSFKRERSVLNVAFRVISTVGSFESEVNLSV